MCSSRYLIRYTIGILIIFLSFGLISLIAQQEEQTEQEPIIQIKVKKEGIKVFG
jgi:hypothetical protein